MNGPHGSRLGSVNVCVLTGGTALVLPYVRVMAWLWAFEPFALEHARGLRARGFKVWIDDCRHPATANVFDGVRVLGRVQA